MKNIFSIVIIVAAIASFVLIVQPQYQQIKELQTKSVELDEVLTNARRLQSIRDDLIEKRNELASSDLARLEKLVPESVDNVKLILELQNIANQYRLEIQNASTDKEEEGEESASFVDLESRDYGVIALDFNITGAYGDFINFLRDVERNLRITDVRALSLAPEEDDRYSFQITLETYWLKDNI